ncbi:hypothetical protein ACFSL6_25050 [Paenibacillus thailandensis]|uniref:Uncharacterized protein n=1 Tax=Paenibacillus thailandensis TaxID=393250 RepID=A0ABW5QX03_9BACL
MGMAYPKGWRVTTPDGKGVIWDYSGVWYVVKLDSNGEIKYYTETQLK